MRVFAYIARHYNSAAESASLLSSVASLAINIVRLRISAQYLVLKSCRVARTYVRVSDRQVSFGFLMRLTIGLILTCA